MKNEGCKVWRKLISESGTQVEKVFNIVMSDPERKVVVVSAPGKRYSDDIKVTDLLISLGEKCLGRARYNEELNTIVNRYAIDCR